jgi:hypothetical protein
VATFYGMLQRIPDRLKIEWGYGPEDIESAAERMEREGVLLLKWETLGD